ncbi:MAG TPA: universal stress protein [Candidatus Acidoferrales bacterium]|nr:universal stress protein [Candidatus Acidoferrales bacterium]
MAAAKTYLVAVDFSPVAESALDHAVTLARERKGKIVLLHVIPTTLVFPADRMAFDLYRLMERNARENLSRLVRRKRLQASDYRLVLVRAADTAEAIARQAKKFRAAMIVMGSHGRTGFKRFLIGSVAEKTLRYATCPVLIVKQ